MIERRAMYAKGSLYLGLVVLIAAGCRDTELPIAKATVRPVKLYEVSAAQSARVRRFPGTVKASETADLSFRIAGELTFLED